MERATSLGLFLRNLKHLVAFIFKANAYLRAMFSGEIDSHYIVERHSLVARGDKMIGSVEIAKGIKGAKMSDIKSTQNKD